MAGVPLLATSSYATHKELFLSSIHISIHDQHKFFYFPVQSMIRQVLGFFHKKLCSGQFFVCGNSNYWTALRNHVQWPHDIQSHLIRDAVQLRCWQSTWISFAGPLSATSAIIFHLIFPPQFPELGRVDRGAGVVLERNGGGMGLNKDAGGSPSKAKFFPLLP